MATDENSFRLALLAIVVVQSIVSLFYMRRAKTSSSIFRRREEGIPLSILMGVSYLGYCYGIVVYLIDPAWMSWSAFELSVLVRWMGGGTLLFGAFMVLWGFHHLSSNFAFSVSPKESNTLITSGPYHYLRHPLYSAFAVQAIGISLLMANWFVAFCASALWLCLLYRTPMEEEKLIEQFGEEYRQHMAKTGRYFPHIKRWSVMAKKESHGIWYWAVMAIIHQIVIALPAGIAQAVGVIGGISGTPMWERLLVPLMGIPFNCGGLTLRVIFEALVEPLEPIVGHRSATVASNFGFYAVLLTLQVVIVTTIIVMRGRRSQRWSDPVIVAVMILLLLNSLVNVTWPWWGS